MQREIQMERSEHDHTDTWVHSERVEVNNRAQRITGTLTSQAGDEEGQSEMHWTCCM